MKAIICKLIGHHMIRMVATARWVDGKLVWQERCANCGIIETHHI